MYKAPVDVMRYLCPASGGGDEGGGGGGAGGAGGGERAKRKQRSEFNIGPSNKYVSADGH